MDHNSMTLADKHRRISRDAQVIREHGMGEPARVMTLARILAEKAVLELQMYGCVVSRSVSVDQQDDDLPF